MQCVGCIVHGQTTQLCDEHAGLLSQFERVMTSLVVHGTSVLLWQARLATPPPTPTLTRKLQLLFIWNLHNKHCLIVCLRPRVLWMRAQAAAVP